MADIVVMGVGLAGLCSGMLLTRDGHRVRILERDPASPPTSSDDAWTGWERRGVNQFRMLRSSPAFGSCSMPSCPTSPPR